MRAGNTQFSELVASREPRVVVPNLWWPNPPMRMALEMNDLALTPSPPAGRSPVDPRYLDLGGYLTEVGRSRDVE